MGDPLDDPAAQLDLVERELVEAHRRLDELRADVADPSDPPLDPDRPPRIDAFEDQAPLIVTLERRREELRARLGTG
jgi:hypothetical protein